MLTISNNGEQIPLNFDDYYIQEVYGGKDAAGFTLPLDHPGYQYLFEETPLIDTETKQRYLIKAVSYTHLDVYKRQACDRPNHRPFPINRKI